MKKISTLLLLLIFIFTLTACSNNAADLSGLIDIAQPAAASAGTGDSIVTSQQTTAATVALAPQVDYDPEDLDSAPLDAGVTNLVQLNGDMITVDGSGATVDGSTVTITAAGTYQFSGTLNDGQIIVDTSDSENVILILAGVDITSLNSAPFTQPMPKRAS